MTMSGKRKSICDVVPSLYHVMLNPHCYSTLCATIGIRPAAVSPPRPSSVMSRHCDCGSQLGQQPQKQKEVMYAARIHGGTRANPILLCGLQSAQEMGMRQP